MERDKSEEEKISEDEILSGTGVKFEKNESSQDGIMSEEGDTSEEEIQRRRRGDVGFFSSGNKYYSALYGKFGKNKNGLFEILGTACAPLKKLSIKIHVNGSAAEVSIEQTYFNKRRQSLRDACFFYAIGRECKIIAAKAYIDGKAIEKDIAKEIPAEFNGVAKIMEAKLSVHEDPFQGRLLSKISIPKIRPKSEAVITIKYVTEAGLVEENGSTHLRIPTTLVASGCAPERYQVAVLTACDGGSGPYVKIPMEIEVTGLMKGKRKHLSCTSNFIDSLNEEYSDGTIIMKTVLPGTDPTEIEQDFIISFDWMEQNMIEEQSTPLPLNGPEEMTSNSASNHPLHRVFIHAKVMNFIAEINMKLKYVNRGTEPINVKSHRLPIERGAAVVECTATIGGELIETKMTDELTAKQDMQEMGASALLLEQLNSDTLGISINKLKPNTEAIVTIKYLIELPMYGSFVQLTIPATISPIVPLKVEVATTMQQGVKSISSPTHEIVSEKQSSASTGSSVVKTSTLENGTKTDNDFIVSIECDDPEIPIVFMERSQEGRREDTMVIVSIVPSFELERAPKEVIFVADRSSQNEKSWSKKYHKTSSFVIGSIFSYPWIKNEEEPPLNVSENCFFNVVRFGKFSSAVFSNGREAYSRATVEKAIGIIGLGGDDMGEKNLLGALQHVVKQRPRNGLPRQIVVFVYGKVVDEEPILNLVRQHAHDTTIFCVGIGDEVSKSFIRDIARVGGGTSHFSDCTKEGQDHLEQDNFLPELKVLTESWEGSARIALSRSDQFDDMETIADISPYYKGNRLYLCGKFPTSRLPSQVRVTSDSPEGSSSDLVLLPRDKVSHFSANRLHRLVARKLMRKLENRENVGDDMKERIVKLAVEYQLVSKFTSFVGQI
eukprot:Seg391.16 transcript_id=Seg391.16/GoldUCD/mRNA.D3Y31 product="von Willebrand factor A domain-containing protein 5A" protein_id=Seg391.16/GoldUCD/D3Y31